MSEQYTTGHASLDRAIARLDAALEAAQIDDKKSSALLDDALNRLGQSIIGKKQSDNDVSLTKEKKEVYLILQNWLYNATVHNKKKARIEVETVQSFLNRLLS